MRLTRTVGTVALALCTSCGTTVGGIIPDEFHVNGGYGLSDHDFEFRRTDFESQSSWISAGFTWDLNETKSEGEHREVIQALNRIVEQAEQESDRAERREWRERRDREDSEADPLPASPAIPFYSPFTGFAAPLAEPEPEVEETTVQAVSRISREAIAAIVLAFIAAVAAWARRHFAGEVTSSAPSPASTETHEEQLDLPYD